MQHLQEITPKYNDRDCILCGESELKGVYERPGYILQTSTHRLRFDLGYQLCKECGLVFMNPQLTPDCWREYLANDSFSPMDGSEDIRFFDKNLRAVEKNFYQDNLNSGMSFLEIGCGDGHFLAYIKTVFGCRTLGIDLSRRHLDYAGEKLGLDVRYMAFEEFPVKAGPFDIIYSHHCMEHLADPLAGFAKVRKLLADNGRFILEVPSVHYPLMSFRDMFSCHNFLFSPATMRTAISRAGLTIIAAEEKESLFYILKKTAPSAAKTAPDNYAQVARSLARSLASYNDNIAKVCARLERHLERWHENRTRVAIWGAGEHTLSLLQEFDFSRIDIRCIIDSNACKWGSTLGGYRIVAPSVLDEENIDEILISSNAYEVEIADKINELAPSMPISTLYEDAA